MLRDDVDDGYHDPVGHREEVDDEADVAVVLPLA